MTMQPASFRPASVAVPHAAAASTTPGDPSAVRRRGRVAVSRVLPGVVLALMVGLAAAQPARAAVLLATTPDGEMMLVDPDHLDHPFVSVPFRLTLDGQDFRLAAGAGAARMQDGRLLAALQPVGESWGLFDLDARTRSLQRVADLDAPLSALAATPDGDLWGITFQPARLVRIDPASGSADPVGPVLDAQAASFLVTLPWASLVHDPQRNRFLYAFANHDAGSPGVWALYADGSAPTVLEDDLPGAHRASQMVWTGGRLLSLGAATVGELEVSEGAVSWRFLDSLGQTTIFGSRTLSSDDLLVDVTADLACAPDARTLCLGPQQSYRVTLGWRDPNDGQLKAGRSAVQSPDSGTFWFVGPSNLEVLVKVLDTCAINGHRWVFGSASSDLEFSMLVEETATGAQRVYANPAGNAAEAITDTVAFSCS